MKPRAAATLPTAAELARNRAEALELVHVSRETLARLDRLVALLLQWQQHTNLVAGSTLPQLWTRHIADSLQLLRLAPEARTWVDLGSGAGFPGLVVACALADAKEATVHLVESISKKCRFLTEAIAATGAPAVVHCERIEDFAVPYARRDARAGTGRLLHPIDVVSARAVAPLPRLLELAAPLLKTGAVGVFPKGQDVAAELTAASKYWRIEATVEPSLTSPDSSIIVIRNLEPRSRATVMPQPGTA